jgi:toxin ParE1/3/4
MPSARLTPRAARELRVAAAWIAEDNPPAADAFLAAVSRAADLIGARPLAGRARPELGTDAYRFWSLRGYPYLLVYAADADPPIILRVLHQARDLPTILRSDERGA